MLKNVAVIHLKFKSGSFQNSLILKNEQPFHERDPAFMCSNFMHLIPSTLVCPKKHLVEARRFIVAISSQQSISKMKRIINASFGRDKTYGNILGVLLKHARVTKSAQISSTPVILRRDVVK